MHYSVPAIHYGMKERILSLIWCNENKKLNHNITNLPLPLKKQQTQENKQTKTTTMAEYTLTLDVISLMRVTELMLAQITGQPAIINSD